MIHIRNECESKVTFGHPGVFVYPLMEKEVVVGFEAVIAGRLLGVQIQSRGKLKDCCLDCCAGSGPDGHCGTSREWGCCGSYSHDMQCTNGEDEADLQYLFTFPTLSLSFLDQGNLKKP